MDCIVQVGHIVLAFCSKIGGDNLNAFANRRWLVSPLLLLGLLLIHAFFNLAYATANTELSPLNRYFQETWTTRDGLPHNTVNSLSQTPDGYIWLTTWEGAARYNGYEFTVFGRGPVTGLPDNGTRGTYVDDNGILYIGGARGGLTTYHQGEWHPLKPVGILVNEIIRDAEHNIWVSTEGKGLYREAPDGQISQWSSANGMLSNAIYSLAINAQQQLLVGTSKGLMVRVNGSFQAVTAVPNVPIFDVLVRQHDVLLATESGVLRWQGDNVEQLLPALANTAVSELLLDHQNSLWIGTIEQGVWRKSESRGLEHLEIYSNLRNNRVMALMEDSEHSIWIGTNGGLLRLRDVPFTTINQAKGLSGDYIRTVLTDKSGDLWIGSSSGLDRYSIAERRIVQSLLPHQSILSLAQDDDGTLYVGTFTNGVFVYKNGQMSKFADREHGLISNEIRAILITADKSIWIGTSQGISIFDQGRITNKTISNGLPGNFVMAMNQINQQIWIGTGAGVAIWDNHEFHTFTLSPYEDTNYAFSFYYQKDKQLLWAATDRGLIRHNLRTGETGIISQKSGLPFDKYFQIIIDDQHDIWMTSNRGILRFSEANANAVLDGELDKLPLFLYGESDGMLSSQANGGSSPTMAKTADGSLWMATARGVVRVDPKRLYLFSQYKPQVVIESLRVDANQLPRSDNINLAPDVQRIEIRYAGLSYIMPSHINYRTRLRGFDRDWRYNGKLHHVEYTNLAPGKYQLEIQAQNPGGEWSASTTLNIVKQPFWWQTIAAKYLGVLLLMVLVVTVVWWRTRRLRLVQEFLQRQVAIKTEELQQQTDDLAQLNQEKSILLDQLKQQADELEKQAKEDKLTGLPNRRAFDEQFAREFKRAKRSSQPLVLAFLDADHFKQVNDTYSHEAGDMALELLAEQLQQQCREFDIAARWGGEEFALLLPSTTLEQGLAVGERLRYRIASMDCHDIAPHFALTVSIGVACSDDVVNAADLLKNADKALYRAKANGRNRVEAG